MEDVHRHHPYHKQQEVAESRLAINKNLLSSSMASMASLAAAVGGPGLATTSPSSQAASIHLCAGCQHPIKDRYLLQALESYWHEDCLKCSCCGCRLGEVGSNLFTKANLILCKRDYLRLFGATGSCAACCKPIPAFEMVMRAKNNVYHLDCFACQQCHQRFCVGDRFYLCDNQILCEYDYEERLIFANLATPSGCHPAPFNNRGAPPPPPPPPPAPQQQQQSSSSLPPAGTPGQDQQSTSSLTENGNGSYDGDSSRHQNSAPPSSSWNGSLSPSDPPVDPHPPSPRPAAPVVKPPQDSPGAAEHDASSSGYGSPDSGGLIDEG